MARNSLIAGGSRSASTMLKKAQQKTLTSPAIDTSEEALAKRAEERKTLKPHPLQFTCSGHESRKTKQVTFNFHPLATMYPHHSALLNQLLNGISLSVNSGVSTNTIRTAYSSAELFINFLNDSNLTNKEVTTVRDIDEFVLQAFKTHLTSSFPGRSTNRKTYNSLTNAIVILRKRYSEDPLIGETTLVPRGPKQREKQVEGYNPSQMKELIRCCLKDIKAIKKFHAHYNTLDSNSPHLTIVENGHNNPWRNDPDQRFMEILATIKNEWPDYPYYMTLDSIKLLFGRQMDGSEQRQLKVRLEKALENCSGKISFMNGQLGRGAIFAAQHFVPDTIFPFLLLMQIATGFNAECVKFMSDNFGGFIGDDLVDPANYAIIYGYKARTDKAIPVRSKKKQANGAYQLLQYVASIITKYKDSEHYIKGVLFQYTRAMLATKNADQGLICSFHGNSNRFSRMGQAFVKRHALEALIGTTVDARKIRSGFGTILQEGGVSASQIGEHLGHRDAQETPETADKHYLSDTASIAVKNKAIAGIQNKLVSDIANYKTRIVSSKTLQQMRDAINSAKDAAERTKKIHEAAQELNLEEKVVVHLLDSGAQTYILACEDMTKPTWPGHEDFVKNGQCRQYNKCCMCKQAVVFPEALPFIAKRIMDIEDSQKTMTAIEWVTNLGDEHKAWTSILDAWNNKQQVEDAWEAAKNGKVPLPKVMRGGNR